MYAHALLVRRAVRQVREGERTRKREGRVAPMPCICVHTHVSAHAMHDSKHGQARPCVRASARERVRIHACVRTRATLTANFCFVPWRDARKTSPNAPFPSTFPSWYPLTDVT